MWKSRLRWSTLGISNVLNSEQFETGFQFSSALSHILRTDRHFTLRYSEFDYIVILNSGKVVSDSEEEERLCKLEDQLKRKAVEIHKQIKLYKGESKKLQRSRDKAITVEESG